MPTSKGSMPAFRILYRVPIQTQDIKTFHSMEEYRVADLKYGVSSILKNCDFFVFFCEKFDKNSYKKGHFWGQNIVSYREKNQISHQMKKTYHSRVLQARLLEPWQDSSTRAEERRKTLMSTAERAFTLTTCKDRCLMYIYISLAFIILKHLQLGQSSLSKNLGNSFLDENLIWQLFRDRVDL